MKYETRSNRILLLKETLALSGLSRSSMYKMVQDKLFPQPVKLNKRSVGWVEYEVQSWLDARIAERDAGVKTFSMGE